MMHLTFDIDWAPDYILEDLCYLLEGFNIKATFFSTHSSPFINSYIQKNHEIGIHPNFNPNFEGTGKHFKLIIDELLELFPMSKGIRSHSLAQNSQTILYCSEKGIKYDSSIFIPYQLKPYLDFCDIYRIPFQQSDFQMIVNKKFVPDFNKIDCKIPYTFLFHPIHIYLNTKNLNEYEKAKVYINDYKRFKEFKNDYKQIGIRNSFKRIISNKFHFTLLNDLLKGL
tara:strand:+ start:1310 stop:1987 length:678 start_codon:yes stop_codon:yes gene_type:complete